MVKGNTYTNKLWIALITMFLLVTAIGVLTPKNPDDYGYYLLGSSLEKHFNHYLTWSGRFFIDYFSSTIMAIHNSVIIALLNSLAIPILIYNIVTLINYNNQKETTQFWKIASLLFISYWLTNPALGESTFWIIGAANYLWPLVVISFYIKYLLKYINLQRINNKQYCLIYLLAFLSGCSNEALSITLCYLSLCLLLFAFINRTPSRQITISCLCLVILGSAILILAPGNFVRAADPIFNEWKALTFSQRLYEHFTGVFPNVLKSYGLIYFIMAWGISYGWTFLTKKDKQLVLIFITATLVYGCVLIASPMAYKPRTYVGGVFFLYLALAFMLDAALDVRNKVKGLSYFLLIGYLGFFLVSYTLVFRSYLALHTQEKIRLSIIDKGIKKQKIVYIPSYYAPYTIKKTELPALDFGYRKSYEMASYYKIEEIITEDTGFNYSPLISHSQYCSNAQQKGKVKCIFINKKFVETSFILELSPDVKDYKEYQNRFAVKIFTLDKDDKDMYFINIPIRIVKVADRYFAVANVVTNLLNENNTQQIAYVQLIDMQFKQLEILTYSVKLEE
ncbi:hypothetical protein DM558_10460 [Entomomonas moraniae]|uniref:Uncharacterized protein n=1 Tax=Entomomonas moraniae TaxID=2213226 RepID=A0A3S9XFF1_9GAMM|nr:DUF6056 family protein [Entomomonas moraniae]AZS51162.1 hypothetical protein DM558_10460 [Entomomonas moraniae]